MKLFVGTHSTDLKFYHLENLVSYFISDCRRELLYLMNDVDEKRIASYLSKFAKDDPVAALRIVHKCLTVGIILAKD
jgi:hypothetical protein